MTDTSAISEARKLLLERLRRGELQVSKTTGEPTIPRTPGSEGPPSPGQEQIWFHAQMAGSAPIYNESVTIHRHGPLDLRILERCFQEIARRHELWRSAFPMLDGKVIQRVDPNLQVTIPFTNLSHLPAGEREAESARLATEDVRLPFDLNKAPLYRLRAVRWSEDYHRIYLTVHHLVFDGVSIYRVMISELGALYEAYANGRPSPLPEPALQYRDYSSWKQDQVSGADYAAQLKYWREQLEDGAPSFELPADRPRPAQRSFSAGMETCTVPASMIQGIKELARNERVTPYMILLAVFQVLLYRYSGQDDVIVGGATNTRTRPELESLIGYFLNAVVYRSRMDGDRSFREFLESVKSTVLGALAHSDIPFDAIVRELAPQRDPSRHPLFQVLFSMRPPFSDFPPGWDLTDMEAHSASTGWDLFVEFSEHPDALAGRFVYSTELFDRATILRMQEHFLELLRNLLANPDYKISEVPWLTEQEQHTLIEDWNNTTQDFPDVRLHELFEACAEVAPDRCALVFRGRRLTYAELNARANQLAHYLREHGAVNGSWIGVYMERSIEMVVALLAILKSGGAYIPYDPDLPISRLNMMIEGSKPVCVITQQKFSANLAGFQGETLVLDGCTDDLAAQQASNPRIPVSPSDAIYAIYTSGTTGIPKAAINTHEAVANRILWMQDQYQLQASDRVLQKTPYSFDVSVWEFFWPLVCGATLVIADPGGHRDAAYLAELIGSERITTIHFVPSMLREFLDEANLDRCSSLKRVFASGEALPPDLRRKFFQRFGALGLSIELHNLYGPTEAAVDVTYWDCSGEPPCATVPIGRPIANVKIYILDRHLAPVPIGVPGELHIGGVAVARGYLNRPELTQERFIADPFDPDPDARLYKTGDRARYLPDGNIEYLDRNDNQIKLRGLRIELGEITEALLTHPMVKDAVVILREDQPGDKRLVAYLVSANGIALPIPEVRDRLKTKLPDYMVPSQFVMLETLPRLANGKLNRRSLPVPESTGLLDNENFLAPRNPIEERLVAIWEQLLNWRPIGIRNNFFDSGGHSMLLIRLIVQIEKVFGQRLPVASVMESPTVEALAAILSGTKKSAAVCRVIPLKPEGKQPPFICLGASPLFLPLARLLGPDQPFCGFDLTELNNKVRLPIPCRLEDLAAYVVEGILEYQSQGPYRIGGWCRYGLLAYEAARQMNAQGHEVELLTLFDSPNPSYVHGLSAMGQAQMRMQKWLFHLSNLAKANPAEILDYSKYLLRTARARLARRRERDVLEMGLQEDLRLMDLDPVFFYAATHYVPPPYPGSVLMVQAAESPSGAHWQIAQQWGNVVGKSVVLTVPGGHDSMFRYPYVEILARKLMAVLEASQKSQDALLNRV